VQKHVSLVRPFCGELQVPLVGAYSSGKIGESSGKIGESTGKIGGGRR
jgi:hypothetical protein